MSFGMKKQEWLSYPTVKKIEDMITHFDTIREHEGQTDRQTDGHTDTA